MTEWCKTSVKHTLNVIFPLPALVPRTKPSAPQPTRYAIFKLFLKPLGSLLIIKEGLSGTAGHRLQQTNSCHRAEKSRLWQYHHPACQPPSVISHGDRRRPRFPGEGALTPTRHRGDLSPMPGGAGPSLPPTARGDAPLRGPPGPPQVLGCCFHAEPGLRGAASPKRPR